MINNNCLKICENDDNNNICKRDAQALCFHCSKNLCRIHLLQHTQLIEENTRVELNLLADKFNELLLNFENISISSNILEKPLIELEKWRIDAHEKIDQIVENKRVEINNKIEEYRINFTINNNKQLEKINTNKNIIIELIQEADASRKQINELQTLINETEKYLQSLNTHTINIIHSLPISYIHIDTQFFNYQPILNNELRNFKIIYIRLNGIIRNYYVKTKLDGTINDLINSFIRQYILFEQIIHAELNSNCIIDHQPKSDFILPVEIYNHNVRQAYMNNTKLTNIRNNDTIVFYETPYSLDMYDNPRILMPCYFQSILRNTLFGFPIYLSVPRKDCKGQDILDALNNTLGNFFPFNLNINQNMYKVNLVFNEHSQKTVKILNNVLQDQIDFNKTNTTLIIDVDDEIVNIYNNNQSKYEGF